MISFTLSVENLPSACRATGDDIRRAIESLRSPTGPTYINLTGSDGSYAQAGGTNGRYVIESRDVYGEGFRHWRAGVPSKSAEKTSVSITPGSIRLRMMKGADCRESPANT